MFNEPEYCDASEQSSFPRHIVAALRFFAGALIPRAPKVSNAAGVTINALPAVTRVERDGAGPVYVLGFAMPQTVPPEGTPIGNGPTSFIPIGRLFLSNDEAAEYSAPGGRMAIGMESGFVITDTIERMPDRITSLDEYGTIKADKIAPDPVHLMERLDPAYEAQINEAMKPQGPPAPEDNPLAGPLFPSGGTFPDGDDSEEEDFS